MKKNTQTMLYGSGTVGSKGQIVIPIKFREHFNISQGDTLIFMGKPNDEGIIIMKPEEMLSIQKDFEAFQRKLNAEKNNDK